MAGIDVIVRAGSPVWTAGPGMHAAIDFEMLNGHATVATGKRIVLNGAPIVGINIRNIDNRSRSGAVAVGHPILEHIIDGS